MLSICLFQHLPTALNEFSMHRMHCTQNKWLSTVMVFLLTHPSASHDPASVSSLPFAAEAILFGFVRYVSFFRLQLDLHHRIQCNLRGPISTWDARRK